MSDRLKQLQHQRALLQEQLAWLDREIQAESKIVAGPAVPPAAPPPTPAAAPVESLEQILARYQTDATSVQSDVKRGCFLYFFLAFALVGLGVIALYLYSKNK